MPKTRSQRASMSNNSTPAPSSLKSGSTPSSADSRKVMFSPSTASRVTAFVMKNNIDVFTMQKEMDELRERVALLDGGDGRSELLDRLKEREAECEKAEAQLRALNDKFHNVQKGLVQIDEERQNLRESKAQLEKEKKDVQRQLDMREKEVLSLVKRCSAQEEKVKESSKIRASHSSLVSEMEDLRSNLLMRDEEISQLESVKRHLARCKDERDELFDRLAKLRKDHDSVSETLNSCFQNMQKMTDSKAAVEEERKRDMQRAELELEKQRLAHLEATNALRSEIRLRQERIEQMENVLKDNMAITTDLRREKAEWHRAKDLELARMNEEHANERSDLIRDQERTVQGLHDDYRQMISTLRAKLDEKDRIVSQLEGEVSSYMQKSMALSEDLQKLQESSNTSVTQLDQTIQQLRKERDDLSETLASKESLIAELTMSLSSLDTDKSVLITDVAKLKSRIKELEEENAFIMDLEMQLFDVHVSSVEVEEQRYLEDEEHQLTVEILQQELEDQREVWKATEERLYAKIKSLENDRDSAVALSENLEQAKETIQSLEVEASSSKHKIAQLTTQLAEKEVHFHERTEELNTFILQLDQTEEELEEKDAAINVLKNELEERRKSEARALEEKELELSTCKSELSSTLDKLEELTRSSAKAINAKDREIAVAHSQLEEIRSSTERCTMEMMKSIDTKDNELLALQTELENYQVSSEREIQSYKVALDEKSALLSSLKAELSALHDSSGQNVITSKMALQAKEDAIQSLRTELEESRHISTTEIARIKDQLVDKEAELSSLKSQLVELQTTAERSAIAIRQSLEEREQRNTALQAELDQLRVSTERDLSSSKERVEEKETIIATLRTELERARTQSSDDHLSLKSTVESKEEALISLRSELEHHQVDSQREIAALREKISDYEHSTKLLRHEVEELQRAKELDANVHKKRVSSKDELITSLKAELDTLRSRHESDNKASRDEIAELKVELQRAATTLSIKEDEIRELRLIELQDAEETIASLQAALVSARSTAGTFEEKASGAVSNLKTRNAELLSNVAALEHQLKDQAQHHERTLEKLRKEVATLVEAKETLEADHKEQSSRLSDRHSTISTMTRKNLLLEGRERSLRNELEVALKDGERYKEEKEKALVALEREITRHQVESEEADLQYQKKLVALEKEMADVEERFVAQQEKLAELERTLEDRTKLLGDMVLHNKDTDEEKEQAFVRISELEQQIDLLDAQREATEDELCRIKATLQKRESQFLETIEKERQLRELAEADLDAATSRLNSQRRGSREVSDLEKENNELKDKVRRQEEYLKRKIQKEKVLRERKTKNVGAATPARNRGSPLKKRPGTVNRNGGGAASSSVASLSETASFPDEWDMDSV